jgi:hypothetical protein
MKKIENKKKKTILSNRLKTEGIVRMLTTIFYHIDGFYKGFEQQLFKRRK